MKKQLLLPALLIAALSATFVSCKKDDNSTSNNASRKDMVVGNWNFTGIGTDDNNNNALDVAEYDSTFTGLISKVNFNADGSGKAVTAFGDQPFTWSIQNNDTEIRTIETDNGTSDTTVTVITTLTQSRFESYIKGSTPKDFTLLTK